MLYMPIFSLSAVSISIYSNLPCLFLPLESQRTKSIMTGLAASDGPRPSCTDFTLIVGPSSSHQLFQDARNRAVGSLVLAANLVATPQSVGRIILQKFQEFLYYVRSWVATGVHPAFCVKPTSGLQTPGSADWFSSVKLKCSDFFTLKAHP